MKSVNENVHIFVIHLPENNQIRFEEGHRFEEALSFDDYVVW